MIIISRCIYVLKNYKIIKFDNTSYLVINSEGEFETSHTHCFNAKIAKILVMSCVAGEISPRYSRLKGNKRFVTSALRICSNKHKRYFENLLEKIIGE